MAPEESPKLPTREELLARVAELERLLGDSERRQQTQIDLAADAIVVHDNGRFVYANCAALGLYGARTLEELQQVNLFELVPPEELPVVRERTRRLLAGEEVPLRECRLLRLDGQTVPIETSAVLIEFHGSPAVQIIARDITERKRAEKERERLAQELKRQRSRFEAVLRQMPIGVIIVEAPSGRLTYHNEAASTIFRRSIPQVQGISDYHAWRVYRRDGSRLPPEQYPITRALLRGERVVGEELEFERGDGSHGFVSVNAAPITDGVGRTVAAVAAFSDISERIASEEALRRSEERLNLALDATGMGSCYMDLGSGLGVWSQQHFLLLGYQPPKSGSGPATLKMWLGRTHPEDRAQVERDLDRACRERSLFRSEHRILRADDGRTVWVNVLGRCNYDRAGEAANFIGVIFEVSERKAAEEKLRESELRYRLLFETASQGIVFHDGEDRIIMANPAMQQILDLAFSEFLGKSIPELSLTLEREDGTPFPLEEIPCSTAIRTGREVRDVLIRLVTRTGTPRWLSISSVPLFRPGVEIPYQVYATVEDVTERRKGEEALRASEAKFRWLFESNLLAIFFWKKDGRITEANQAYCDLVGFTPEECSSGVLNWLDSTPPEQFERDFQATAEIMAQGICRPYEKEFINRSDGRRVPVLIAGARMAGGESEGMGFAIDLTELKRAEQKLKEEVAQRLKTAEELHRQEQLLVRQGRLAALGEMIGNIAHQWRQPLNTLGLIVQELLYNFEHEGFTKEYLSTSVTRAMQIINHMSKTIDGFRKLSVPDKERTSFKVAELLTQTVAIVEGAFKELHLEVEVQADPEICLEGNPNEFSQVVLNILVNAKDALLERRVESPRVVVRLFRENGKAVLVIADNAGGIPPEIMDKIFDPYFTTKGPDKGTGIGLFMSRKIVEENMNGTLSVRNTAEGAEFRIEV